jgi:surfactin synthase thioesterase subunit
MKLGLVLSARGFFDAADTDPVVSPKLSDQAILDLLQQYEGTPAEVLADAELRRYVIRVMRNDLALLGGLCRLPKQVLDVPVQLVGGDGDSRVPVSRLAAWQQVFNRAVTPKIFAGGHFYLFSNLDFAPWLERCGRELLIAPPLSVTAG